MNWYKSASLVEGPSPHIAGAFGALDDPLHKRPIIKYIEAERMRVRLRAITSARLKVLQVVDSLAVYPEVAAFRTPNAGLKLWLILMCDFYAGIPTLRYEAVNAISGQAYRKTEELIRQAAADGALVIERNPQNQREHLLFPSLMTLLTYEFVMCPAYLEESEIVGERKRETLRLIYEFWEKRRDALPEALQFNLAERQKIAQLRIVS